MRELNVNEIQEVNGGLPPLVWFAAGFIARRYGSKIVGGAIGGAIGWASEP